ncbi:hypothetical protein IGB42_02543 [Andreprevotia sp. IGB-42]|uniref:hypothetical protein n=1 Tax=Andreprevotia sp. IGB-42 TaxID=2497473 RepID=UPI00135CB52A|nr:hypothetical protein [Andreprevotia sp. IGB-42]KAF0813142.1 hypothetical protein IGB42_02543 [Andreprevotia sp. IGB-42]
MLTDPPLSTDPSLPITQPVPAAPVFPLPLFFRLAQGLVSLEVLAFLGWTVYLDMQPDATWRIETLLTLLSGLALQVGLWRRLVWGRVLTSMFGVWAAFTWAAVLLPDQDCLIDDPCREPLLYLLGYSPAGWINWCIVMAGALFFLLPLAVMGWRAGYFRRRYW